MTGVLADRRPASLHFFRNFEAPEEHHACQGKSPFPPPPKPSGKITLAKWVAGEIVVNLPFIEFLLIIFV